MIQLHWLVLAGIVLLSACVGLITAALCCAAGNADRMRELDADASRMVRDALEV